jgi:hypothetical protein
MANASDLAFFSLSSPTSNLTTVLVTGVTSNTISANYSTLPGNQPNSYGNTAFLWQSSSQIPYNEPYLASYSMTGNTEDGSFVFPGLTIQSKSYIVGYAVGTTINQICATCYIPASGTSFPTAQTNLDIQSVSTDSAIVNYQTPDGNLPLTNANWIGLWQGNNASYTVKPLYSQTITTNNSSGLEPINNFSFKRSTTYTLAYFMGAKQTMMAATYTFST